MRDVLTEALRGIYRRLVPARAKNTLRLRLLFDERDKPPQAIEEFDTGPVLVLAPHMDDEVVGCGGAVRRHVLAGAKVTVVFLTDGRLGNAELRNGRTGTADGAAGDRLSETRKRESARAAEILGTQEHVFLDEPDGALEASSELVQRLAEVLERTQPTVVYLPSLLDTHLDHWVTSLAFHHCLSQAEDVDPALLVREYEVWTPLLVNRIVDIEGVLDDKLRALRQFESQLPELDLVGVAEGLSKYRSIHTASGRGHAEAYHESTVPAFRRLVERFLQRS